MSTNEAKEREDKFVKAYRDAQYGGGLDLWMSAAINAWLWREALARATQDPQPAPQGEATC